MRKIILGTALALSMYTGVCASEIKETPIAGITTYYITAEEENIAGISLYLDVEIEYESEEVYIWTTDRVNIRKNPSTSSEVLDTVNIGSKFTYIKEIDNWVEIKYNGDVAYIRGDYISYEEIEKLNYTERELYLMSHLIMGEAGSDVCSDKNQLYVASVVMNRVASDEFPDTIEEVIFQDGQYACTWDGNFYRTPNERAIENAKIILQYGSMLPSNVVYQSGYPQGSGTHEKVQTHYFCYR